MRKPLLSLWALLALAPPALAQNELSLEGALSHLSKSADWHSAELSYESAVRQLEAAQAATGLRLSAGGNYSLTTPLPPSGTTENTLGASVSASLGLLPWSSSFDNVRSAQRALERASLSRRDARNAVFININNQYFGLRQATNALALAQATVALRQNQLRIAIAQNQAGSATLEQVLSAQQNVDAATSSALSSRGNLELAQLSLANTLGLGFSDIKQLSSLPSEPRLSPTLSELLTQALQNRSDIGRAQLQLQDAQENLAIAQRDRLLPDSSLSLGFSTGSQGNLTILNAGLNFKNGNATINSSIPIIGTASGGSVQTNLSLGLSVSLPLLDPSADGRIGSAQSALALSQDALQSTRRAAELDVRQKYLNLQTAMANIQVSRSALDAANQSLRTAEARLQAGTNTASDIQSAKLNLLQVHNNLEAALIQAHTAHLALQNAIGVDLTGGKP